MKKTLLFLWCSAIMGIASAQDTIAAWTFPTSIKTPTTGLAINMGRFIGTENDVTRPITFTTGQVSGDTAATTIGWNNGVMSKYWILKFKTTGYTNIKISSKQRSGNQNSGGPKEFLIQWSKGSPASWSNITNDTIRCGNDWTSGVVSNLTFPAAADTATSNISVRWVLATDINLTGTAIDTLATTKIDDIIITGTAINTGIETILYSYNSLEVYPNPSTGIISINNANDFEQVIIYNQIGAVVFEQKTIPSTMSIDLSVFGKGIYYLNMKSANGTYISKKVIII
jgi:hypothetical protein